MLFEPLFGPLLGPLFGQGHSPAQSIVSPWHFAKHSLGKVLFSTPQTGPYTYAGHSKKHRICLDSFSVSAGADWIIIERERTSSIVMNILNNYDVVLFLLASLCVVWTWLITAGVFTWYLCPGIHLTSTCLHLCWPSSDTGWWWRWPAWAWGHHIIIIIPASIPIWLILFNLFTFYGTWLTKNMN